MTEAPSHDRRPGLSPLRVPKRATVWQGAAAALGGLSLVAALTVACDDSSDEGRPPAGADHDGGGGGGDGGGNGGGPCANKTILVPDGNGVPALTGMFLQAPRLTATSTHIYWIDRDGGVPPDLAGSKTGSIKRVAKSGGAVEEVFAAPKEHTLYDVVAIDDTLFVLHSSKTTAGPFDTFLSKLPATGGSLERLTPARERGFDELLTAIAGVDGPDVLVMTSEDRAGGADGARLIRVNGATGAETVVYDDTKRPSGASRAIPTLEQVSREGDDYYFLAAQGNDGLWKVSATTGTASVVTDRKLAAIPTLVGGGHIFTSGLKLERYALDFTQPTTLVDGIADYESTVRARRVEAGHVFVAVLGDDPSPLLAVKIDDGARRTVVCDGLNYGDLIADESSLYWIDAATSGPRAIATAPR